MLCLPCFASASPPTFEVTVTDDALEADEYVYLLVDLKNNIGFGAVQFCITYDEDKLNLEDVTLGELLPSGLISSVNTDISGEINFSAISAEDITDSGTVLVAKFKASDAGTAKLDFKLLAYADSSGTSLDATTNDVEIIIESDKPANESNTPDNDKPMDKPDTPDNDKPADKPDTPDNDKPTDKPDTPDNDKPADEPYTPDTDYDPPSQDVTDDSDPPAENPNTPPLPEVPEDNNDSDSGAADKKDETTIPEEKPPLPDVPAPITFADVSESHWAYNQICLTAGMGLFNGTAENTFSPSLPMTRAMFVTVLYRYAGSPEAEKTDFSDVGESWYTDAVSWAAGNGIVYGTGENKFSPDQYITRGEIATILCRFKSGKRSDSAVLDSFSDHDAIPDWGRESIAWAVEKGLIMGREGGLIAFSDNAVRAESAVIFARFLNV